MHRLSPVFASSTHSSSFESGEDNFSKGYSIDMERYSLIAARTLVSIIFLLNGLNIIGQTLAVHEMAVHGVPVSLIPTLIMGARALQLIAGTALVLGIYPPCICHRFAAVPDTSYAHGPCILGGGGHIAVYGSADQLLQECVHGWWIDFYRRRKRSTCSASTQDSIDSYAHGSGRHINCYLDAVAYQPA